MQKYSDGSGPIQGKSKTDLSDLLEFAEPKVTAPVALHDLFALNSLDDQGCDVPLSVSMFADVKAQRIEPARLSLRQIQARLTDATAENKEALPLVKLATFGDARTVKGNSLRHDANLLSVSGVEGDYDAGTVSPQQAFSCWTGLALRR